MMKIMKMVCGEMKCDEMDILDYSSFLLLPFGAGLILGVYVTVLVTISRTWRTLGLLDFGDLISKYRPLLFKSHS